MTSENEIPERYQEQFCTIKQRTGNFNFADPSETQTLVKVVLPEYDFQHEFSFDEGFPDISNVSWTKALYEVVNYRCRLIGDREPQERLHEIYDKHIERIENEWEQYRRNQIDDEITQLRKEKKSLQ